MAELADEIHAEIQRLCALGDKRANAKQFPEAYSPIGLHGICCRSQKQNGRPPPGYLPLLEIQTFLAVIMSLVVTIFHKPCTAQTQSGTPFFTYA